MERYTALLPVDRDHFTTLGAGMTPLVPGSLAGLPVYFKLDSLLPSGSFKDRGGAVSVAHLKSQGATRIIVDSSGNAAAAMAAYSAAAGIECVVYAPASASAGKLVQSRAYGAEVRLIDGPREAVAEAAQTAGDADEGAFYVSHNWSPVFAEGVKTWALEVWEQLDRQSPERVFVPTGGGSALMGAYRGFQATAEIPAIVACQPAACAPLVAAWDAGATTISPVEPETTIAEGARIAYPPRDTLLLDVLRASHGAAQAVSEEALIGALRALWRQGIYVEPTAALGAAAFIDAATRQEMPGATVILITGNGLKATDTVEALLGQN